jgi:ribosomal protein S27AE
MSKFLRHINCPRCGSKDNLAEYDDHFWCFGCKYHKLKNDIGSIRNRIAEQDHTMRRTLPKDIEVSQDIPKPAMQWLLSYGITPNEINDFGIGWNDDAQLLVLVKTPDYWQARTFGNHKVKYMSNGIKPLTFYGYADKIVCVEDILSAIKISRLSPEFCALPLLGSSMSEEVIQRLSGHFKSVVIWLDRDKANEAIKIARNLKQRGFNSSVVISPLDPKEYSKGELSEWLKSK